MVYDYSELVEKTRQWAEQAGLSGWINNHVATEIDQFDSRSPDALFSSTDVTVGAITRPLIVAFMGGTGVGKSSLLNRLAGQDIARAGIARPTSREVTLYHHQSISIDNLPKHLPLSKINISQHDDESNKNIVWIDMPDFDSIERTNKEMVFQWLPHIDVLIYVVSPERYKDEKAWRLLLAEGARHAWLFVFNQWDRGQLGQYEDFNRQLQKAQFVEPVIFKTVCTDINQTDEFVLLKSTILSIATEHIVSQLEQRSLQVRKDELKQNLLNTATLLGSEMTLEPITELWIKQWQHTVKLLLQGFEWPLRQTANYYAEHAADLMANTNKVNQSLWDAWAQGLFNDGLDEFIINVSQMGLPVAPLRNDTSHIREKAQKIIQTQTELATRMALANPGNTLQRTFLKFMRLCEIVLPLTAMIWVGYKVFMGYYVSNMTDNHYLGIDFTIHSGLLIAVTWLIPYFILKKLQPSLRKSALKGLNKGLVIAFGIIESEVLTIIEKFTKQHAEQVSQLSLLIEHCSKTDCDQTLSIANDSPLHRMLMH